MSSWLLGAIVTMTVPVFLLAVSWTVRSIRTAGAQKLRCFDLAEFTVQVNWCGSGRCRSTRDSSRATAYSCTGRWGDCCWRLLNNQWSCGSSWWFNRVQLQDRRGSLDCGLGLGYLCGRSWGLFWYENRGWPRNDNFVWDLMGLRRGRGWPRWGWDHFGQRIRRGCGADARSDSLWLKNRFYISD